MAETTQIPLCSIVFVVGQKAFGTIGKYMYALSAHLMLIHPNRASFVIIPLQAIHI